MVEEKGYLTESLDALFEINSLENNSILCTIDTGFSGSLLISESFAKSNNFIFVGLEEVELIDGVSAEIEVAIGKINWFEKEIWVRAFISKTDESLIGTELLKDTKLEIDYINSKVKISK